MLVASREFVDYLVIEDGEYTERSVDQQLVTLSRLVMVRKVVGR